MRCSRYGLLLLVPLALFSSQSLRILSSDLPLESQELDFVAPLPTHKKIRVTFPEGSESDLPATGDAVFLSKTIPKIRLSQEEVLKTYNASYNPVLDPSIYTPSNTSLLHIHLVFDITHSIGPQSKFLLDGLERSQYIQVTAITFVGKQIKTVQLERNHNSQPVVWMVDWGSLNRDCHALQRVLMSDESATTMPPKEIVLVDFSGSSRQVSCPKLNPQRIRLVKGNIVQHRYYNDPWIELGEITPNLGSFLSGGPVLHAPYVLRERFVEAIGNSTSNHPRPYDLERPIDVAFFWDLGDYSHYGKLRRSVSAIINSLHRRAKNDDSSSPIKTLIKTVGNDQVGMEAGNIQKDYIDQLLSAKIVVVAQRDEWEDHYRLMESLASGAMVMTDRMLAMPAGLENKTSIVVYDSAQSLKKLIRYYLHPNNNKKRLAIAKNGWKVVMGRHRAWHRVEEILFGRPLTHVDKPDIPPPTKRPRQKVKIIEEELFLTQP